MPVTSTFSLLCPSANPHAPHDSVPPHAACGSGAFFACARGEGAGGRTEEDVGDLGAAAENQRVERVGAVDQLAQKLVRHAPAPREVQAAQPRTPAECTQGAVCDRVRGCARLFIDVCPSGGVEREPLEALAASCERLDTIVRDSLAACEVNVRQKAAAACKHRKPLVRDRVHIAQRKPAEARAALRKHAESFVGDPAGRWNCREA